MAQGALPFKYEEQLRGGDMTALAGLPVYLDLAHVMGLSRSAVKHLEVRASGRGWTDAQVVTSLVHTEFRDGNVPAGYEQLRVFKEALSLLPEDIKTVRMRSDTAGYQHDLLKLGYCDIELKLSRWKQPKIFTNEKNLPKRD